MTNHEDSASAGASATAATEEVLVLNGIYRAGELIGKGSFGEVRRGRNLETNQEIAVKIVDLRKIMDPREWSRQRLTLQREIAILKVLDHPNIVKLYDAFEKDEKFYLIMEYVSGGELYQHISTKKVLTEVEARKFFRQLVSALEYCHSSLIIHRDLKLENVLLDSEGNIKITDFGFSNFIEPGKLFQTFCGSPMYSAPEIFAGQRYLGPPVDIWSLGVILFSMVSSYLPFSDVRDIRVLRRRVCRGEYQIPDHLSVDCQKLIKRMMRVRQEQRLTVQEIRRHPWVNKGYDSKPESYLQSYPKVVHPLPEVVHQLIALGFSRDECVRHLANNKPKDQIVATYYHIIQSKKGLSEGNSSPTRTPSPPRTSTPAASITETLPPTPQLWERLVHAFGLKE